MVREGVGDWRLAWRFGLAGLIGGLRVPAFAYLGLINRSFDAAQDQLFPAPSPDPRITLVAIDQKSNDRLGNYPWLNSYHAKVINYLASLHPTVILFDIVLDHDTGFDPELPTDNTDADLSSAIKSAGKVVLVCTADDRPRPEFANFAAPVGERGFATPDAADSIRGVEIHTTQTCPHDEAQEPAFLQALRISQGSTSTLSVHPPATHPLFGPHHI